MKVVVTGGTGQIGGAILRHLNSLGGEAVDVSRSGAIRADLAAPDFAARVAAAVPCCDAVVHCAASMANDHNTDWVTRINVGGTQLALGAARLTGARCFIYLSSVPVIGRPRLQPIDEEHPVSPLTAYHTSKLEGEKVVSRADCSGLRTACLRLTSPIGPGTPPGRIFSEFAVRAQRNEPLVLAGQGGRRQNYVDVRDIAVAVAQCLQSSARGVFNVAGAAAISNLELARRCVAAFGSQSAITFSGQPDPDEDVSWDISIEKAGRAFGYAPSHSVEDSIAAFHGTYESRHHQ